MTVAAPVTVPQEVPVQVAAPSSSVSNGVNSAALLQQQPQLALEENNTDINDQNNVANVQGTNQNVPVNTAFQPVGPESLGGDIQLNSPWQFYGQTTTTGRFTQGTVGVRFNPRGRAARRILKKRNIQIDQQINRANLEERIALEGHCAKLSRSGVTSATCTGIVTAINPQPVVQAPAPAPVYTPPAPVFNPPAPVARPHVAPAPVRGLW